MLLVQIRPETEPEMILLNVRRRCIFIVTVCIVLSCSAQLEQDKFAGNLDPDDSASEVSTPVSDSNLTGHDDVVHVVSPSKDTPSSHVGSDGLHDGPNHQSGNKNRPQKAPPPVGKPESVGFISPPEENVQEEENVEPVVADKTKVHLIPTLPPSIIKPGRMSNGSWYIVLYAPWCVHSQAALSEFLQTIQYVVDNNITQLVVGKIDVIKHGEVGKHFRIQGIPTILFFKHGIRYTFDYPEITFTNLVKFMEDVLTATVSRVNTSADLAELKKNHSVLFLIVHDEKVDRDWQEVFMKQANDKALKAKFAFTTNPDIVEDYDLKSLPSIMVLKDDTALVFRESLSGYVLSKWILMEKDVAFPTVNSTNIRKFLHPVAGRRVVFLVVNDDTKLRSSSQTQAIEVVERFAKSRKLHSNYQFGLIEGGVIPEKLLRSSIGNFPFIFAYEPYSGYYYLFQPGKERGQISEETIANFLRGIISGEEERLGGVTFLDQVYYLYQLGNGIVQSMIVHRPYLSIITGLCMLGVVIFYTMVCWQSRSNKLSPAEIRTRKAARARKRKEELAKREAEATRRRIEAKERAVAQSRDSIRLRKRREQDEDIAAETKNGGEDTQSGSEDGDSHSCSGSEEIDSQTER